jgi:hypothetical protein
MFPLNLLLVLLGKNSIMRLYTNYFYIDIQSMDLMNNKAYMLNNPTKSRKIRFTTRIAEIVHDEEYYGLKHSLIKPLGFCKRRVIK